MKPDNLTIEEAAKRLTSIAKEEERAALNFLIIWLGISELFALTFIACHI